MHRIIISLRQCRYVFALSVLTVLLSWHHASAQDVRTTGSDLYSWVEQISGKDPDGRRAFVRSELASMGLPYDELPFDTSVMRRGNVRQISGINMVARLGSGNPVIVIGAHYDAVPGSPGSNDNGAGVAILLGLLKEFQDEDLQATIEVCFFDQEEVGLIGSAVYVRDHANHEDHRAMINLDVVGFGTELFVGPVGDGDDDLVLPHVEAAAESIGKEVVTRPLYPSSDHLPFARAGLENIAISIVPEGDADRVQSLLAGTPPTPETLPVVLRTMHTAQDGMDTIEPEAMRTVLALVKNIVLQLQEEEISAE